MCKVESDGCLKKDPSKRWPRKFYRALWREQRFQAVSARALIRLAHCFTWAKDSTERIKLRYDAKRSLLKIEDERSSEIFHREMTSKSGVAFVPKSGLATFNRHDRFLRMKFFSKVETDEELITLDVDYSAKKAKERNTLPSFGLLAEIAGKLEDHNIHYVSSRILEMNSDWERGKIRFLLPRIHHRQALQETQMQLKSLLNARTSTEEAVVFSNIRVNCPVPRKVFISLPINAVRRADLEKAILIGCEHQGFEPVYVLDPLDALTDATRDQVRECDAFLQIIVLRENEKQEALDNPNFRPNFDWLHFEWGLMTMLNVRGRRLIDDTIPTRIIRSAVPISRDQVHPRFSTQSDLKRLSKLVEDYLSQVE